MPCEFRSGRSSVKTLQALKSTIVDTCVNCKATVLTNHYGICSGGVAFCLCSQ